MFRELETMPFDKAFTVGGNEQLCNATGYEWVDGNGECWNGYVDSNGDYHYGR